MKVHVWLIDFTHFRENCPTGVISRVTEHNGIMQHLWTAVCPIRCWGGGNIGVTLVLFCKLSAELKRRHSVGVDDLAHWGTVAEDDRVANLRLGRLRKKYKLGALPLTYIGWTLYALVLVAKMLVIFLTFGEKLSVHEVLGSNMLELAFAMTAAIFALVVSGHKSVPKNTHQKPVIRWMQNHVSTGKKAISPHVTWPIFAPSRISAAIYHAYNIFTVLTTNFWFYYGKFCEIFPFFHRTDAVHDTRAAFVTRIPLD